MAATGKTPILLYGSTTATNTPSAGNLTNSSDGCEIAINVADKNLFFKDSTNVVNTVPIRQSGTSSNGWLSSTDWNTFNGKASTSSPTFSGDVTLSTGNLVIGTSGKGIDFSATAGTGTSELLADYEEGTWTPTGNNITYTTAVGRYTKVGRLVSVQGYVAFPSTVDTNQAIIFGLPYTTGNVNSTRGGFTAGYSTYGAGIYVLAQANSTYIPLYTLAGGNITNANMSSGILFFGGQYTV